MPHLILDARVSDGGVGRYASNLRSGLAAHRDRWITTTLETQGRGVLSQRAPFTPWGRLFVARAVQARGADILHSLHLELPRTRCGAVVTVHDVIPLIHTAAMPNPVKRWLFHRAVMSSLDHADRVIVPSTQVEGTLIDLGAEAQMIRVIPMAVAACFSPLTDEERAAASSRFADGRPYVAAVAASKAHKNLASLESVAASLEKESDVRFIARTSTPGDGPVASIGPLSDGDLRLFYGGAECLVMPSIIEGFGLPAVEALACGTTPVCGRSAGVVEYLEGTTTIFIDPADDTSLLGGVGQALAEAQKPGYRDRGSQQAALIKDRLSVERMVASTIGVYEEVLDAETS